MRCSGNAEIKGGAGRVSRGQVSNKEAEAMFEFFRKLIAFFRPPNYDPKNPPLGMEAMDLDSVNKTNSENERIEGRNWRDIHRR